ncbi:MAG: hypothetical protein DRN99_01105 [Thermoproteota archaeon]|nr:MAG: hypothetical protein DRN99_01105 [Candidatus Korarchaeota archaeon]
MILLKNAIVVTQDAERRVLPGYDVLIDHGRIADVARGLHPEGCEVIDVSGCIVAPGLINTHTHIAMTFLRGIADDMPLRKWLEEKIWPLEAKLTREDVYRFSKLGIAESLLSGVTCFVDMYFYPEEVAKAAEELGSRAVVCGPIIDFPTCYSKGPDHALRLAEDLIKMYSSSELIKPAVGPHAPYTCSKETLMASSKLAREHGVMLHIHLSETKDEVEEIKQKHNATPTGYLESIGFFEGNRVNAAHCVWLTEEDMDIIASREVYVSHNPVSNMKLASGIAPVSKLIKKGAHVTLGTDGPASNNILDMFQAMKMACLLQKLASGDPTALTAQQALDMATIEAAKSIGLGYELGSIEPGKQADIIVVDFEKPHLKPLYNPVSHLVYAARAGDVKMVLVRGELLVQDGKLTRADLRDVIREAEYAAKRIVGDVS